MRYIALLLLIGCVPYNQMTEAEKEEIEQIHEEEKEATLFDSYGY